MHLRLVPLALLPLLAVAACGEDTGSAARPIPTVATTAPPTEPTEPTVPPPTTTPETDPVEARADLDAARERWAATGWAAYRFVATPSCFCPPGDVTVDVIGGRPVGIDETGQARSVEQWFDEIETAIGTAADVRVTYDDTGAPASLYIDVDEMTADEEFGFELVALEPVTDGLAGFLHDEYGCGYGFAVADADQTVSMVVSFIDIDWETGPEPGVHDLAAMDGAVHFGADLMANWCDDVIEDGEPEPIVDETWEIVSGSLDLSQTDNRLAIGVFTDVVAVDADGHEHELGTIEVANGMWGFFAG